MMLQRVLLLIKSIALLGQLKHNQAQGAGQRLHWQVKSKGL